MKIYSNKRILQKGETINETYNVDCFIGEGLFGEVYRVKHRYFDELQAMKIFKKEYLENTDLEEVITEARILCKLLHPNVVRVFEVNRFKKDNDLYYFIATSYISGEPLSKLLKRKIRLEVPVAVSIMIDVLRGLEAAHCSNEAIIHRDINPDNILLSYEGHRPIGMLADFGLARSLNQISELVSARGRYFYFAPECIWDCYLQTSDVFSLGMIFYEMLTGTHPWEYNINLENYDHYKIMKKINSVRKNPPIKPSMYINGIDKNLEQVILKSLENKLENRYRTASTFLEDLKKARSTHNLTQDYWKDQKLK